ncbi:MAG: hypothetical protein JRG92_24235 [Deltaproteobacteria bacterium]|nr:hypothetical protein [Deltaproteobacteria bacterium]
MILLNGGVPFMCFVVGIAAFTRFRLDSSEHRRIRNAIDRRARGTEEAHRPESRQSEK